MNNVSLIGRLTNDPTQRMATTANGDLEVSRFNLAVDRRFKREGEQQADFISCTAFGKTAELINLHLHQGSKIGVTGRIQTGSYTNKDGQTVYTTDVIVEQVTFCERKADGQTGQSNADDFVNIPDTMEDEGLPFK